MNITLGLIFHFFFMNVSNIDGNDVIFNFFFKKKIKPLNINNTQIRYFNTNKLIFSNLHFEVNIITLQYIYILFSKGH